MADPFASQTTFLARFEGTDGDQFTFDEAPANVAVTFIGAGDISSDYAKFGSTCYHHVGNSRLILGSPSPNIYDGFLMADQDWTVELFMIMPAESGLTNWITGFGNVAPAPDTLGWGISYNSTNNLFTGALTLADGTTVITAVYDLDIHGPATGAPGFVGTEWHHMHLSRHGTDLIIGIDGYNVITSGTVIGSVFDCSGIAQGPVIGGAPSGTGATQDDLPFYCDNFRVTKGVARYTGATYVVPQASDFDLEGAKLGSTRIATKIGIGV